MDRFSALVAVLATVLLLHRQPVSAMSMLPASMSAGMGQCKINMSLKSYNQLNQVCEDCYGLTKNPEYYVLCKSNCFGSEVFAYCMGELLVATDMKKQIDTLRESIHGSSFLHK